MGESDAIRPELKKGEPCRAVCIKCFDFDAFVTLDLDGSEVFRCNGCDAEFGPADVRQALHAMHQGWVKLLQWVEQYPKN